MATRARRPGSGDGAPAGVPEAAAAAVEPELAAEVPRPRRRVAPRPEPAFVRAKVRLTTPNGALAHLPGDLVPVQNVERNGWAGLVEPLDR